MYILDVCGSSGILKIIAFIKSILDIIFIIVPIGLIVMVSIDFSRSVISGDSETAKKTLELGFNRILSAVFLFAVPYIVSVFITIIGNMGSDYATCLSLADNPAAIAELEKQEEAKKEAEKQARLNQIAHQAEQNKKMAEAKKQIENRPSTVKGEGCDGVVYYENGTFYKPSLALVPKNGVDKTKGSAAYGYNKYFYENLTKFAEAAKKEGHTVTPSTTEYGAWRPYKLQVYFYNCMINKNCNNGNLAATPGRSNHGWAIASDLSFGDTNSLYWAHDHANEYNLRFPLCNNVRTSACVENWHIEPLSVVESDERAKACV